MKINEFFQKGYYMNLDRRTDRRAQLEKDINTIGLEGFFERHICIDVKEKDYVLPAHEPEFVKSFYAFSETLYNLFLKMDQSGFERILVFEDDILFYNKGPETGLQIVEKALDQLQNFPDWDMIYFGGYVFDNPVQQVSENLLKANTILTTHAVGYNKKAFKKLLRYAPAKDAVLDGWLGQQKDIQKYFVYPLAVAQRDGASDLDAHGSAPGITHWEESYKRLNIVKV